MELRDSKSLPLGGSLSQAAVRFGEFVRLMAAIPLLLYAVGALVWLVANFSFVIEQEVKALQDIRTTSASTTSTSGQPTTPQASKPSTPSGDEGSTKLALGSPPNIPIINGLLYVNAGPVGWLILCLITSVLAVLFAVYLWTKVVENWVIVRACNWTGGFWAALECALRTLWAVIVTVITVVISVLVLVYIIANIIGFFASL